MQRDGDVWVCIIGAGPSGIIAAKNMLQTSIKHLVAYDKNDRVDGNWIYTEDDSHSSVYETTHIISSKNLSQFEDFPIPNDYPDYPSQAQLLAYFQSYAEHFHILDYILFNSIVSKIEKISGDCWRVILSDGSSTKFEHLLIASGHHHDLHIPEYPGKFLHSHSFKMPPRLRELSHTASWWLVTGSNAKYGLQSPENIL